ncbi:1759_t:CDS:1 [Paraglomus occultum]|uniref:1759_t:CDS:1 n=1 Tax=Paraglomus occultum TaxID=144539 RepID=A0A9N8Z7N0_9GLOM|nr:1759_t:CDS:1 [Paraglomus occultum]
MSDLPNKQETTFPNVSESSSLSFLADQSSTMSALIKESLSPYERKLLANPPYVLTMSLDDLVGNKCKNRGMKKLYPPRPQNAWIIFRKNFESEFRSRYPNSNVLEISKIAGANWKNQPRLVKTYFETLSKLARQQHKHDYPSYTYVPRRQKLDRSEIRKHRELVIIEGKISGYGSKDSANNEKNRDGAGNKNKQTDKCDDAKEVLQDTPQHKSSAMTPSRIDVPECHNVNNMPAGEAYQAVSYACTEHAGINYNNLLFHYYPAYMFPLVEMTAGNGQPYTTVDGYVNQDYSA